MLSGRATATMGNAMGEKIFLAGAGGVVGRRLSPLLRDAGYAVYGSTRKPDVAA